MKRKEGNKFNDRHTSLDETEFFVILFAKILHLTPENSLQA